MDVWLTKDSETGRITAQARPFERSDFPPGLRGQGWERRKVTVPRQTWTKLVRATTSGDAQDRAHRRWWAEAEPDHEPLTTREG